MRARGGGRIITVTHPGGKAPAPESAPSSVSRAAGIALTKVLSKEYARHGICVNTVCVGSIKSAQWSRRWQANPRGLSLDAFYDLEGQTAPLGRMGEAAEVADLIAFLVFRARGLHHPAPPSSSMAAFRRSSEQGQPRG